MRQSGLPLIQTSENTIVENRVLRNTYLLLSVTLLFSAAMSWYAMSIDARPVGFIVLLAGMFGLYFLTIATRNSGWGILSIFAYTGFMGYVLGPMLSFYIKNFANGPQLIATALGATGVIFVGLSAYTLVTRKNFSYLGGVLAIGVLLAFIVGIGAMVFHLPMLQLVISGAFALISAGYILFMTSQIVHGGERNYIMATIVLYISIFNLFVSLLNILGALSGNRN
jgi:modulator of FtsH protease